ncbi:MAG TPA: hypothetical protein VGH19_14220 [Verrucomicrobiae bacterium]
MKNKLFTGLVLSSLATSLAVNQGHANPLGGTVAAGNATITGEGSALTTINQTSQTAVINWQDFSIGLGEITRFIQPGADSAVLNRVLSGSPSQLLGTLQANGQVYLINPNGIFIGSSGQINVNTFVASTLDIADSAFLSGGNMQFLGSTTAGIENLGTINALGGDIFLFGHTVKNSGTINASGTAGLAAGMSIELRQQGNERIGVLLGNTAAPTETGVDNQGLVQATSVEVNAAGGNIYAVAINNGGTVRAQPTLVMEGGKLVLKSVGGTVINSGTLDASNADGKGGDIVVAGDKVGIMDGSVVNASGSTGGGTVKIGGGFQGNDASVVNASKTFVGTGAQILADATTVGDGGTVIVWSDEVTRFGGSISAKGGAQGGNGGFAEVSGKEYLQFTGGVDLRASAGITGTLLLDPRNIQILDGNIDPVSANDAFAENATLNVIFDSSDIETLLNSANVTLQANNDITVDSDIVATAGAFSLQLQAGRNIFINQNITVLGSFTAIANDTTAISANRVAGAGAITMAGTATLSAAGNVTLTLDTLSTSGDITVSKIDAGGSVFISNNGTTAGSDVLMADAGSLITVGAGQALGVRAVTGDIGTGAFPLVAQSSGALMAFEAAASGNIFAFVRDAVNVGGASGFISGISAGGTLSLTAQGNITQNELITASGAATFTVDTANPADVLLGSQANNFGGTLTIQEANGGLLQDVAVRNVNAAPAYPVITTTGTLRDLTLIFDNANLTLPATTITGNLVATSGTGSIAQSGILTVPGTTTLSAGTTITLGSANEFTGAVASTSAGNTTLVDATAIVLGTSSVGGNLSVTAGTGITQTGVLTVTGASTFTDTGADQDIVLTQANQFGSTVNASGLNVSITEANGLVMGNVTVGGNLTVSVTAGDITSTAGGTGIDVAGTSSFTASGAGVSITLDNTSNDFTGAVSISGPGGLANVSIFDLSALVLNAVSVTGNLTVTATGITQSGVITVGGATTLDGNGSAIDLGTQNNNFNSVTASDATNLFLDDVNDIVLGAITISGNLTVDSGLTGAGVTGSITQTGALTIGGTSTFTVNGANLSDVLLASAANNFSGAITVAEAGAGNIQDIAIRNINAAAAYPTMPTGLRNLTLIFDNAAIDLPATTLTGTLTVTAGGAITDSGDLLVTGVTTLTAGNANNITLNNNNNFSTVSVVSGNNVVLNDTGAIDLGASTISGTLNVTAAGLISDSGNLLVTGTATLAAGGTITLDSAGNDFNTVSSTAGGNVTLVDVDNIDLGASTIGGGLTVTAAGAITDSGALTVTGPTTLTAGAANNITLDNANDFGTVSVVSGNNVLLVDVNGINLGASTVSGTLGVTANGPITDSGALVVTGAATLAAGAANNITLDDANNFSSVGITSGNNVVLNDINAIALNASTVSGTLSVTAVGAITDNGALVVTGAATFTAGAANDITLDNANDFSSVGITSGNNVVLNDINAIALNASTVSGTLSVTAAGAITDNGALVVAGAATFAAGAANNITLDNANNFNSVGITSGNNVTLNDINTIALNASTVSGTLTVTAAGVISDNGALLVTGATTLTAGAANNITLDNANNFSTVSVVSGNNVSLNDINALDLGASTITGTLTVTTAGAITDSGDVTVGGATSLTAGAANDITLNSAGNDFNAVTVVSAANVTIVDVDDITFSASSTLATVAITGTAITLPSSITTTAGQTYTGAVLIGSDMTLSSTGGGNLTFTSTIDSTSGGAKDLTLSTSGTVNITGAVGGTAPLDVLDIRANAINFGAITASTSVTLRPFTAGTAIGVGDTGITFNISDMELDGITSPLVTIGDSTSGAITAATTESITIGYGITLVNNSSVTFGANTFSTTGALTVNANGAITDASGATISVTGLASFNAGAANSITLGDNGGDTINFGTLTVNGNNVTITEDSAMQFAGSSTIAGNLTVTTQAGDITQAAGSSVTVTGNANLTSAGNISLGAQGGPNVNFGTLTFTSVTVAIYETSGISLIGTSSATAVALTALNGDLTDDVNASLTVTTSAIVSAPNGNILLGESNTDFISFGELSVFIINSPGTATITENDSTVFSSNNGSSVNGNLTINSGGSITDESNTSLVVTGNATFNANLGASDITLGDNGGDTVNFGSLTVVGNNVTITEDSSTLITGINTVNGFLNLTSAGTIADATGVTINVTGNASFNATAAAITLGDQGGDTVNFGSLTFNTTGGAVAITEDSDTGLVGSSTADSLVLVSSGAVQDTSGASVVVDNGNASFTGTSILLGDDNEVYSVSGTASFNGGAGAVSVGQGATATTTFGSLTFNTTGGAVTITEDNDTVLAGTSTGDSLVLTSTATITDATGASVTIDNGDATFNGTSISLADNAADVLSVSGTAIFNGGAGAITVAASGTVNFDKLTFNTTSAGVSITEDSATILTGTSTADSLVLSSTGSITDDAGTSVTIDNGTASFTGAGITLADNADTLSVSGNATFSSGANDTSIGQGATATVNFGTLTVTGANVTVTEDSAMNFAGTSLVSGNLTVTSQTDNVDQNATSAISVTATASFTAAVNINIGNNASTTANFGSLTVNGANANVQEDSATVFTGSSTITSALTVTSTGSITDDTNADISVGTVASFTATGSDITLGDQLANDINFGQLTLNGANATITEDSSTDFTGSSTLSGALMLTSNGVITDDANADLAITGNANFNAGANAITLGDNAGNDINFGSVTLNGTTVAVTEDSAMTVAGATATTSLTLSAAGTVNQTALITSPTLSVTVTTAGMDSSDILLNTHDNSVSGAVTFAESTADALRDVLWRNVSATAIWPTLPATATINDLTIQHTMTGISITAALTLKDLAGDSGDLNLLAGNGSITQTAGSTLTIPGTTTLSASGDITLTLANDFDSVGLVAGDGVVTIVDGDAVSITDVNSIIIDASDPTTANVLVSLTVNAGGTIFIEDNNLSTATPVTITTTTFQTYNGAVVLEQDTTLTSTGNGNITFASTVDSDTHLGGAPRDLTVNTGGVTAFNGASLGATSPLDTLTTDDATPDGGSERTELTGTFTTVQYQLFQDPVVLTGNVVNTVTGVGDVTYSQTINGGFALTVNTDETTIFGGQIGNTTDLFSLTTNTGGTTQLNGGGVVDTTDFQTYNDAIVMGGNATLTSAGNANITFNSTVDDNSTAGNAALSVTTDGLTIFNGQVGNSFKLTSLTTDAGGTTQVNGGKVATTGAQIYGDDVTIGAGLAGATTFSSDLGAGVLSIHFTQRVDDDGTAAASNVSINTQGIGRFDGLVGDTAKLTSLTTDAGGETHINPAGATSGSNADANVYTSGNQTYNDDVKLAVDLAANNGLDVYLKADAGATIAFGPRVDGRDNFEQGLTVFADSVSITTTQVGILVPLQFLDISAGPSGVTTSTLTQDTEIQFLVGTAILGIVEANGFNLTITANDINFVGGAGSVRPGAGNTSELTLRPISTSVAMHIGPSADVAGTFSLSDADLLALADGFRGITIGRFNGANPITVHTSTFTDPVRIQAPAAGGTMLIDGLVTSTATPAEALNARDIFLTDVDASNNKVFINSYVLGQGGVITGSAGTPLPNGAGVLLFGPGSTVTMNANIQTAGTAIVINDGVVLNTDVSLNTTFNSVLAGNDITITGAINSAAANNFGLVLRGGTGGNIDIQNTVGNTQPLGDVHIFSANNVDFDNTVVTTGTIDIDTANTVIFRNTVNAGSIVQDAGTGSTTFTADVTTTGGAGVNITSASIVLDGLTINSTTGNGTIRFNGPVTLSTADVTVSSAAGNITFENTVNGGFNLALNSTGTTTFNGLVGAGTALTSVTTDAGGTTAINGAGVTTTANQTYNDNVTLGVAAVTLNATGAGADITFNGTVNGPAALTVNAVDITTFGDAAADTVGGTTALLNLTTDAAGTTVINGSSVTTTGTQIYNDPVTFNNDINFTGSTITFNGTLAGSANNLTVTGNAVFGDAAADSVTTGTIIVTGTATVNTTTVNSGAETQTYNGDVTLNTDVNFTGTTVTFNEDVTGGANNLTVTGNAVFGNAANDAVSTGTILVTGTTTVNGGSVTTTGETQTYNGDVIVNTPVNFTGTTVQFDEDIIAGANAVTVTGNAIIGNAADDVVNAGSLAVTGTTAINAGAITTTLGQTYTGAATLGSSTTLTAGGNLLFSSTLVGNFDLTLAITGSSTFTGAVGGAAAGTAIGDGTGAAITINSTGATEFQSTVNTASGISQTAAAGMVTFRDNVTIGLGNTGSTFNNSVVLDGLTFTSGGAVILGSDATDVVTLSGGPVTLAVTGTTTVNAIVNGNQDLVINSAGSTTFNAAVGGTVAATEIGDGTGASIAIGAAAGTVTFESTVRTKSGITQDGTAGLVTFRDNVTVAAGDTASTFNGNVTLDGLTFTTAKAVTFGDATSDTLTLSTSDVTVTATSSGADGAVTFNSAVNGAVALMVNTAGATTFNGVVGPNITTLTTDAAGTTTINTAVIGGAVLDFNDPIILETSTVLTGTTSVDFAGTVNSAAAEANSLTVNSPITGFHGVVGGADGGMLGTLTTDAAGTTTLDTTGINAAVVDFNDAILLTADVIVTGTTSIDFALTVNSGGTARDLTLNSPVTGFHGVVGGTLALDVLTTDTAGTTTIDTTGISAAVVDFNDAILLTQDVVINGTTSIDFALTVNSSGAARDLTLNSPTTGFHGIVGGTLALDVLTTDAAGTTTIDTTAVTGAVLDFNDAVVIDQNTTLTGTTSVDFASTLNSAVLENNNLTINSPVTGFHGIVGAASPFGTLATDAVGTTTIDTTAVNAAVVDFNDAISLLQDVTINGSTSIDFASTVNSSGAARNLTLNSPVTGFHGIVGGTLALGTLFTDAAGTTTIDTTAVSAAVVDFNDAILLTQDVVINGTTSIDFAGTVNSGGLARDLTLNSPVTGFHGVVGGTLALDVLTTDAAGTTTIDTTAINAATIDFNDAIIIDVGTVLTATTLIDFASTVNGAVGEVNNLTINSPSTTFNGVVGGTTALGTLTTDAAGTTTINTTGVSAAVVDFNDAIVIAVSTTVNGTVSVDFASTVDSQAAEANSLTVNSPVTAFHGIVGGAGGGALGTLTTDVAGVTTIDTTAITGATLDFNDQVTLSQNVVLNGTTTVDFAQTVDSDAIGTPRTLLVNSPLTVFGGAVGGSLPLASLTTDAAGLTRINGGIVTTTGDQAYNDTVRLGANTILTGNDITFATLLDSSEGALRTLLINSTGGGITTFNGAIGTLDRLARLETNLDGRTDINAVTINLNGASALFNDPVLLLANLTINEAGVGSITFNNTLNGAFALVVNSDGGGLTIFNGVVGGTAALVSITTDADGATQINGGTVTTTGFQTYNDPVTIGANTVLNSTAAGNITFVTTLNGPFTLLVNTAGTTTFGGPVGGITPLNSVTTDAPGFTAINGGSVVTFATQTYNDPVTIGANTILTSTGAAALGNVTFNSTLDSAVGPFSMVVNTAGNTDFNGAVGGIGALLSLTTDAPGTVSIDGGAVTTTAFQLYNDVATIGANTVLTSTGAGDITFMQTLDGAFTLNVNTAGNTIFNGVVGGITPLVSVVTDAPGATQVNGTAVTTTGLQTYNDPTTVGANTVFTSTGAGNITFASTLNDNDGAGAAGGSNVTVNTAGATTFGGAVGGINPLTSLTTDAAGNVAINGGLVTTFFNQTYNDVATLGADTVLNSLLAGNITFAQTLDDDLTIPANTSNLIVNTSGITTFGGVVGGISPLTSITTDPAAGPVVAGDITRINGGLVITTGFQTYNDHVTVNQDTTLTSTTIGNITIGQPNPPVPWGFTTLMGTVPGVDMIINAFGGNVQINAAVSAVETLNGFAVSTYVAANPGNTGINLHISAPTSPYVFIYTEPQSSFNVNNTFFLEEQIFGRDVANLFRYPGDSTMISSSISALLSTNNVEKLIGALPTDKVLTSYDLAILEEDARKKR